jgi:Zn-dependent peptidase ImmA (M78 family)
MDLHDVVLAVMRRQGWLSEFLRETHAAPIAIVGSSKGRKTVASLANDIRRALDLNGPTTRPRHAEALLRDLVSRVERLRVNVIRSGIVGNNTHRPLNVNEFRGFALSDDFAPFIFINGVDAPQAQAFTLIHELAHIARGDSGVSGQVGEDSTGTERLCNLVAAEVLVPSSEFGEIWDAEAPLHEAVQNAAQHFRISRYVVAIRAFESNLIDRSTLEDLLSEFRAEQQSRSASRSGGDYYRTLIARNGRGFTSTVVDAVGTQRMLIREAASLLEAKPAQLDRLGRELSSAR